MSSKFSHWEICIPKLCIKALSYSLIVFLLFSLFAVQIQLASAAQPQVTITEVFVDYDAGLIEISGENFNLGPDQLIVSLGNFGNLTIITHEANFIVVEFPDSEIPPGDYLLKVSSHVSFAV